jgi:hypothetical protein
MSDLPNTVTGSSDDWSASDINSLQKKVTTEQASIAALQGQYDSRVGTYSVRANLLDRIRTLESQAAALTRLLQSEQATYAGDLYKAQTQLVKGGVDVTVEISLDGVYYSNPAPDIPVNSIIWVRCVISDAHRGTTSSGVPVTHIMAHLSWIPGTGYVAQDWIPDSGHDVVFVSQPLIITRKFKAPAADTDQEFLVNVDLYEAQQGGF